jgi:hypothetical protein
MHIGGSQLPKAWIPLIDFRSKHAVKQQRRQSLQPRN